MERFAFLRSTRFWAIIIGAVSVYGESKGWFGEAERNLIATIAGAFIAVRTVDRAVDNVGK